MDLRLSAFRQFPAGGTTGGTSSTFLSPPGVLRVVRNQD
jgi:hypothetical protein